MPYTQTQPELPYSGNDETSQACSHEAALAQVSSREWKTEKYKRFLLRVGKASDHQAAEALRLPLSSINSIRNGLGKLVKSDGKILGPFDKYVTLWTLAR